MPPAVKSFFGTGWGDLGYLIRGSLALQAAGISTTIERRINAVRDVVSVLTEFIEEQEKQDLRRRRGLAWEPHEKERNIIHAQQLLSEIIRKMQEGDS